MFLTLMFLTLIKLKTLLITSARSLQHKVNLNWAVNEFSDSGQMFVK